RLRFSGPKTSIICSPMTSLKTSIKTITYLSDIGCLEIHGASLGRTIDNQVFQSGVFNVTLNNGSEWNTVNASNIDTLAINNGSEVNVTNSSLLSDTIGLRKVRTSS
ncbi:hypothetical protein LAW23_24865, partial [Escherichia coli]|nr:hypothetical protein [Escherichia coli]